MEQALQLNPDLATKLRGIAEIGSCPMPPLVAAQHLGQNFISRIQTALLHPDLLLQQAMPQVGVNRFAAVTVEHYEAIAHLYQVSQE